MIDTRYPRYAAILLALGLVTAPASVSAADPFSQFVDEKGQITLPAQFRVDMSHLGSFFVPAGEASGFHDVYTQPSAVKAFRETGKFPDGAVLVKELRASKAGDYTTGKGVHSATSQIKQWFVMVKDSTGRFPKNKIWGDGWGWALFKPDARGKNLAVDYKQDCLGCHLPAKETDLIYQHAYPTLKNP